MSARRLRLIALAGAALIMLVFAAGALLVCAPREVRAFPLPEVGETAGTTSPAGDGGVARLEVTPGNVQAVISAIKRPEGYIRNMRVELFYEGGSAGYDVAAAVSGDAAAARIAGAGGRKNVVVAGGRVYIWFDGDRTCYEGPAGSEADLPNAADEYQMIPTYEDVISLDQKSILDAGYVEHGGEDCIFVRAYSGELGYRTDYYVSVSSGLLVGAEQYEGERLVYRMTSLDFKAGAPDEKFFDLPDGRNALSSP